LVAVGGFQSRLALTPKENRKQVFFNTAAGMKAGNKKGA
jgi:hypothetical protein